MRVRAGFLVFNLAVLFAAAAGRVLRAGDECRHLTARNRTGIGVAGSTAVPLLASFALQGHHVETAGTLNDLGRALRILVVRDYRPDRGTPDLRVKNGIKEKEGDDEKGVLHLTSFNSCPTFSFKRLSFS